MNQQLEHLVIEAKTQGQTKEAIYLSLLQKGYLVDDIAGVYSAFNAAEQEKQEGEDTQKRTISIIVSIGAILIGAGIFSFIAANWQYLDRGVKVLIILAGLAVVEVLAWYFKDKKGFPTVGAALYLLGSFIDGGGIFLVGQIFNIRTSWPDGFMLWMLGIIVMAYAVDIFALFYLAVIVGTIGVIGQPFALLDNPFSLTSFAMTSTALLIITTAAAWLTGWQIRKNMASEEKEYF